jgi:hypothetical protein
MFYIKFPYLRIQKINNFRLDGHSNCYSEIYQFEYDDPMVKIFPKNEKTKQIISHYSIDGYLAVGLVTAGDDIVYVEEIHAYEERIEFKIDENYDDFVKGNKSDFEDSIKTQLVSILQCEPLNIRDLEVSPGSIMVNFTLVGSNDMEADELKQSHAELIALLEAGALKLVRLF